MRKLEEYKKTEELKTAVLDNISDESKQAELTKLIDSAFESTTRFHIQHEDYKNKTVKLSKNFNTSEAQFMEQVNIYNKHYESYVRSMMNIW